MAREKTQALSRLREALEAIEDLGEFLTEAVDWPDDASEGLVEETKKFLDGHVYDGDIVDACLEPLKKRLEVMIREIERGSPRFRNPR